MGFRYLVLGSGMQGTAGGFDLAIFGEAEQITMADINLSVAQKAAARINELSRKNIADAIQLDASKPELLQKAFTRYHGVLSATSYEFNLGITEAAILAKAHLVDLGGNTPVVFSQLKFHERAKNENISIIPDTGLAPGLGNALAAFGIEQLDTCDEVQIRCGGLPQTPKPPLGYKLVFSVKGLTNEYFGKAWTLQDSKITEIDTFSDREDLEFEWPVGKCEAFTTTGGSSTCPWTYQGKVKTYVYKTVRYPGHFEKIKCLMDLGLLDDQPVNIGNQQIVPRDVFHAVAPKHLSFAEDKDLVVLRVECKGTKNGRAKEIRFDLMDFHCEKTGFTAMERTTAYPATAALYLSVKGKNQKGVVPIEKALNQNAYFEEVLKRGIQIKTQVFEA